MLELIADIAKKDHQLDKLLQNMEEYARIYRYAKRRHKGCDGLGELNNLKDEIRSLFDEAITYCKAKGFLTEDIFFDADTIADELGK